LNLWTGKKLVNFWAKTSQVDSGWHPLLLHMLDVAATADVILSRETEATRKRMAAVLGMPWKNARPWLLLVMACHDLGKACPGFQCKWKNLSDLPLPRIPNVDINHAYVSQIALTGILQQRDWPEELAALVADAVGCHHGERISEINLEKLEVNGDALGSIEWQNTLRSIFNAVLEVLKPIEAPTKQTLSGPDFMLLSGLTSFADWIGSNEDWFSFGTPEDCEDLSGWFEKRKERAGYALDAIGWEHRVPLLSEPRSFEQVFRFPPRPLQKAVADALAFLQSPAILLIEAPMGEGKTEAAFYAHLEMQRRFGHRGLYVALPTKATGNAMFKRTLEFLCDQGKNRKLDLQLVHGAALLNDTYQHLQFTGIYDPETGGEIRAGEWFTNKKRALLSEYGVGTVDQAIVPILRVRHNFVRLWGLANRVVVFDEIHAYDAYTGTLLLRLIHWLLELGSSVVLLSATLSPSFRRELAKIVKADLPKQEPRYPRLSLFSSDSICQTHFEPDPSRHLVLKLLAIPPELQCIKDSLDEHLVNGGMGLALVNTVQRAQELYQLFPSGEPLFQKGQNVGKRLADGTEIYLFHARFPANRRQQREDHILSIFGEAGNRTGRKILIATQVAEQSLDLDFDLIVTDLAPIDLILQRAGRLWRHKRHYRPLPEPILIIAGLAGEHPPSFGEPLWWGGDLYHEDLLLLTWILLRENQRQTLTLPDEIEELVKTVYEELVSVPEFLQERMEQALMEGKGDNLGLANQANQAIIGLPDDASWDDRGRFVFYDEDAPGVHRSLIARTRLGKDSIVAIPLFPDDNFRPDETPDFVSAKEWFLRAVNLSRSGVVNKCKSLGIPDGWKKSSRLRNCYPLALNANGCWIEDESVRLDDELGIVYEKKEKNEPF